MREYSIKGEQQKEGDETSFNPSMVNAIRQAIFGDAPAVGMTIHSLMEFYSATCKVLSTALGHVRKPPGVKPSPLPMNTNQTHVMDATISFDREVRAWVGAINDEMFKQLVSVSHAQFSSEMGSMWDDESSDDSAEQQGEMI